MALDKEILGELKEIRSLLEKLLGIVMFFQLITYGSDRVKKFQKEVKSGEKKKRNRDN